LSLALGETRISCAQVAVGASEAKTIRTWDFDLEPGQSLDNPDTLGDAFAKHLKSRSIPSLLVVIGLPAQWVLTRAANLPPVASADLNDVVALQIEQAFAQGVQELAFDYCETPDGHGTQGVMIAAAPKRRIEQARQFALAANLKIAGITTPVLAMPLPKPQGFAVAVTNSSACVLGHQDGHCTRMATCDSDPQAIMRTLTMQAAGSDLTSPTVFAAEECNTAALEDLLTQRLESCTVQPYHPAQAMGTGWLTRGSSAINFADSRLNPKPAKTVSTPVKWGLRVAAVLAVVALAVGYFWFDANHRLDTLQAEHDAIHDKATSIQVMQRDARTASGWFDKRAPILECLLELTHTFPTRGRIWVEKLTLDDRMRGSINCKAEDRDTMLDYVDAMKNSPHLEDVQLHDSSVSGREDTLVDFEITFTYSEEARS